MKKILTLSILALLFFACKKNNTTTPTPMPTITSSYYIEGKVDGVMHHSEYICPYNGCTETTGYYDEFMQMITMQRQTSATNSIGWNIRISDVTLDSWVVPDTLDGTWFTGNEHLDLSYYSGTWDSDHNFLVDNVVLGDTSFQMIVTSKAGDVLQGTFHGTLRNGSDDSNRVYVSEGKFKVHIVRF